VVVSDFLAFLTPTKGECKKEKPTYFVLDKFISVESKNISKRKIYYILCSRKKIHEVYIARARAAVTVH